MRAAKERKNKWIQLKAKLFMPFPVILKIVFTTTQISFVFMFPHDKVEFIASVASCCRQSSFERCWLFPQSFYFAINEYNSHGLEFFGRGWCTCRQQLYEGIWIFRRKAFWNWRALMNNLSWLRMFITDYKRLCSTPRSRDLEGTLRQMSSSCGCLCCMMPPSRLALHTSANNWSIKM